MGVSKKSLNGLVLQLALALFLIVAGLLTLQLDSGFIGKIQANVHGNEIATAVHSFVKGDIANILVIALGACELIAGIFLLLNLFIVTGKITDLFVLIILIVWIVIIVLVDILGAGGLLKGAFKNLSSFLAFLKSLSGHLLVLGALLFVKNR